MKDQKKWFRIMHQTGVMVWGTGTMISAIGFAIVWGMSYLKVTKGLYDD